MQGTEVFGHYCPLRNAGNDVQNGFIPGFAIVTGGSHGSGVNIKDKPNVFDSWLSFLH